MSDNTNGKNKGQITRRKFLTGLTAGAAALSLPAKDADARIFEEFFRQHFKRLDEDDLKGILKNMEEEIKFKYGKTRRPLQWMMLSSVMPLTFQGV